MNVLVNTGSELLNEAVRQMLSEKGHSVQTSDQWDSEGFLPDVVLVGETVLDQGLDAQVSGGSVLLIDTNVDTDKVVTWFISQRIHGILPPAMRFADFERAVRVAIGASHGWRTKIHEWILSASMSETENQIIACVCQGYNNEEIAERLRMKVPAVEEALYRIFKKFRIKSRSRLVAIMAQTGAFLLSKWTSVVPSKVVRIKG